MSQYRLSKKFDTPQFVEKKQYKPGELIKVKIKKPARLLRLGIIEEVVAPQPQTQGVETDVSKE